MSDGRLQEQLETNFFSSVKLSNGTYKFTYSRRLDDLNSLVNDLLPTDRPLRIMDVAVSSGVSTLEWIESLNQKGLEHDMTAGDLTAVCFLLSLGKHLHVLTDKNGYPLQFDVFGRAVPNPPGGRNLLRFFLPLGLLRIWLALKQRTISEAARKPAGVAERFPGTNLQQITLTSPRLKGAANLHVVDDDILNDVRFPQSFDVLRAANILNRDYFDDGVLLKMLRNLRTRLVSLGLLVVCTTEDAGDNHGTIFQLTGNGSFEVVARLNGGSHIEDLVLSL
jgi:hypothetical protein